MLKKLKNLLENEIDPAFEIRARKIFEEIEKDKPKKILDIGCGRGFYLKALSFFKFIKEIHGCDINSYYLKIAKKINTDKRVKIKKADILRKLPYKNEYFDFIICSEVLEHLPTHQKITGFARWMNNDVLALGKRFHLKKQYPVAATGSTRMAPQNDKKALLEIKRILKPNGKLIITVPNLNFPFLWDPINWILTNLFHTHINKNIWWLAGIWADHERLYSEEIIKNLLKKTGFKIIKLKKFIFWSWPFSHFIIYGLGKNLVERFGWKNFNRFYFGKKNQLNYLIAKIFKLPSLLDKKIPLKSSTNIFIVTQK